MPHLLTCKSGNIGPEWSGSALDDDSGWICDECEAFIPVEPLKPRETLAEHLDRKAREHAGTIFADHSCHKCRDGALPCVKGNPRMCDTLHARND